MSKVNLNQLKKSVSNLKNYVDSKSPFKSITSTDNNIEIINELQTDNLYELDGTFKMFSSSESVNLSGLFIFENIDSNTKALRKINNNDAITTTSYILDVNAQTYTINKTQEIKYLTAENKILYLENISTGIYSTTALSIKVNKSDNTTLGLGSASIKYLAITRGISNGDIIWAINVFSSTMSNIILTLKSDGTVTKKHYQYQTNEYLLTTYNENEYTPTSDYNPSTKKYVDDKVAGIVNSAPETLDTLQELATALGNDPNFATTVATQIGKKVDKVDGMSLTHNDLTNELKANYDAAYTYSQAKHSYNDLTDKPTIPSIDGLATEEYVQNAIASAGIGTGSDVATDDEVKAAINAILGGDYIE